MCTMMISWSVVWLRVEIGAKKGRSGEEEYVMLVKFSYCKYTHTRKRAQNFPTGDKGENSELGR